MRTIQYEQRGEKTKQIQTRLIRSLGASLNSQMNVTNDNRLGMVFTNMFYFQMLIISIICER
jgi:hypothetical protein